jgi:hypothetical protein
MGESINDAAVPEINPHKNRLFTCELRPGIERNFAVEKRNLFVTGFETSYMPNFTPPSSK